MAEVDNLQRRRVLSIVVFDKPGVLSRLVGLVTGRGYNIASLTVGHTVSAKHSEKLENGDKLSRMTVVVWADDALNAQVIAQIGKQIDVVEVRDLTDEPTLVEADVTVVKIFVSEPHKQADALTIATLSFRATSIMTRSDFLILRFPGREEASRAFVEAMGRFGKIESVYSGTVAIA
jgi:acetolactate synthase-1/3 small subunit